jgi:ABC-type Fe3+ transport system permease subunit
METLADYGTVAYFAVNTFTTGIYRAWFSLGDRVASAQLAAILLGFVLLLVALERSTRGRARYHNTSSRHRPPPGRLHGLAGSRRCWPASRRCCWASCCPPGCCCGWRLAKATPSSASAS